MSKLLIRNGRIVDPSQNLDRVTNLLIDDGQVAAYDVGDAAAEEVLDASNRLVVPGLVDAYAELQEPGWEEDETIETGTRAALHGGFTSIACVPNTDPPIDTQAGVQFVQQRALRARNCNVHVIACVSKNRDGKELAEMGGLVEAGAVAFCDANRSIQSNELLRRALQYCLMFSKPVINAPYAAELAHDGVMHEGAVSMVLGLPGIPTEAEDVMTGRDLRLAEATGGKLHLVQISSAGSIELIRRVKARGLQVTAATNAVHFCLTDVLLRRFDSRYKVQPPLRSERHVQAVIAGLADGTIDMISAGHAPRALEKKMRELDQAPFGMTGFETTVGQVVTYLIRPGHLSWPQAVEKLSTNPARMLGLERGTLQTGAVGDVTIIDPEYRWTVDPTQFVSKCQHTPLDGMDLFGRVTQSIVEGEVRYSV